MLGFDGGGCFCAAALSLRCKELPTLPQPIAAQKASRQGALRNHIRLQKFCREFDLDVDSPFPATIVLCFYPNSKNPYRQIYTPN